MSTHDHDHGHDRDHEHHGCCGHDRGDDAPLEVDQLQAAAAAGDAGAMKALGDCHYYGEGGLAQDRRAAVDWFLKAALAGHPQAMCALAECYLEGDGVGPDPIAALAWLERAARAGEIHAMKQLGDAYLHGVGPVERDVALTERWYREAAAAGDPSGISRLGYVFYTGDGYPVEMERAVGYYIEAAAAGMVEAMNNLGFILRRGEAGPDRLDEAERWLQEAVEEGESFALCNLGVLRWQQGRLEEAEQLFAGLREHDPEELEGIHTWWSQLAEGGELEGQLVIGMCHRHGLGVPRDGAAAAARFAAVRAGGQPVLEAWLS